MGATMKSSGEGDAEMKRKFTVDGAKALMDMEPFIIVHVWWNGITEDDEENYEKREFDAYIQATNIPTEHCLDDLREQLKEQIDDMIDDVLAGISTYLCQMRFCDPGLQAWYSHDDFLGAYESDSYWEITDYELMSHEPLELTVDLDEQAATEAAKGE